jgi:transglutaminase-like putative cysteine protease
LKNFKKRELHEWIDSGFISPRLIDGKIKFFKRFLPNLFFLNKRLEKRKKRINELIIERRKQINNRIDRLINGDKPRKYRVRARISLELKFNPKEKIKCWLPFPKIEEQVSCVRLIAASHKKYRLAKENASQRTIHFEEKDRKFFAEFEYEIIEVVSKVHPESISNLIPCPYEIYLKEEPPHIVFTPYIKNLAKSIVGKEKNIYLKAKKIYDWITMKVNYTYVLSYSIYENISEYCLTNLQGDCGFQALAFITLCRASSVPSKWQSGWFITKQFASPHDWAMFYAGKWLFADLSFGGSRRDNEVRRQFYFGNLDAYRMPANSEICAAFWPSKKYWRSDPVDNQVGEVENKVKNLYYDSFHYKINVLKFEEVNPVKKAD